VTKTIACRYVVENIARVSPFTRGAAMRLEHLNSSGLNRTFGAAVVRARTAGGVVLELGPADGPPQFRLHLSHSEALQLSKSVLEVANDGGEDVLIVED